METDIKFKNAITAHDVLLTKATLWAAQKHVKDRRKNKDKDPYINHPIEVAHHVALAGGDLYMIMAALFHDLIEDGRATYEEIVKEFGKTIADYVRELTDDPRQSRKEQVEKQVENMAAKSFGAKLIKMADQYANLTSLVEAPPTWKHAHIVAYAHKTKRVFDAGRGISTHLEFLFDIQYKKACDILIGTTEQPVQYC